MKDNSGYEILDILPSEVISDYMAARKKLEARETRKTVYAALIWLGVVLAILHAAGWVVFTA